LKFHAMHAKAAPDGEADTSLDELLPPGIDPLLPFGHSFGESWLPD
jgi:hypothetical protein